jgi:pimeloyl-ACP methyl ester carboxylesterase
VRQLRHDERLRLTRLDRRPACAQERQNAQVRPRRGMLRSSLAPIRSALVHGRRMTWRELGGGDALVLLHAFPLSADMWTPQIAAAPPGWRVIAPDLRGFRGLDAPPLDAAAGPIAETLDDYAGDVLDLCTHLGVTRAVFAGSSMGGYVLIALLRRAAARVRAAVFVSSRAEADTDAGRTARQEMVRRLEEEGVAAVAESMGPRLIGDETRRERPDVVEDVRQLILANDPAAVRAAILCMMRPPDSTALASRIACPALVVHGAEDALIPAAAARSLHDALPQSSLEWITGAGHLPSLERPDAFNTVLGAFLDRLERDAAVGGASAS